MPLTMACRKQGITAYVFKQQIKKHQDLLEMYEQIRCCTKEKTKNAESICE